MIQPLYPEKEKWLAVLTAILLSVFQLSCGGGGGGTNAGEPTVIDSSLVSIPQQKSSYSSTSLIEINLDPGVDSTFVLNVRLDAADLASRLVWTDTNTLQLILPVVANGPHDIVFEMDTGFTDQTLTINVQNLEFTNPPIAYVENLAGEIENLLLTLRANYSDNPELQAIIDGLLQDIGQSLNDLSNLSAEEIQELAYFLKSNLEEPTVAAPRLTAQRVDLLACANLAYEVVKSSIEYTKVVKLFVLTGGAFYANPVFGSIVGGITLGHVLKKADETIAAHENLTNDCTNKIIDEIGSGLTSQRAAYAYRTSTTQLSFAEARVNSYRIESTYALVSEVLADVRTAKQNLLASLEDSVILSLIPQNWITRFRNFDLDFVETSSALTYGVANISNPSISLCQSNFGTNLAIGFCFDDAGRPAATQSVNFSFDLTDSRFTDVVTTYNATLTPAPVPIVHDSSVSQVQGLPLSGQLSAELQDTFHLSSNGTYGSVTLDNSSTGSFTYTPSHNGLIEDSFTFYASNTHGNSATGSVHISITADVDSPEIAITAPSSGELVSGVINLSASVTDNVEVASAEFSIDGQFVGQVTLAPYSISFDTQSLSTGTHTMTVDALDIFGNYAQASVQFEIVQNTAPTPVINLNPTTGDTNTLFTADANATTDQEDLLANLTFRWNWTDTNFPNWDGIGFSSTTSSSHTYTQAGVYRVWLQSQDTGGLTSTTSREIVVSANSPPTAYFNISRLSGSTTTVFLVDSSGSSDPEDSLAQLQFRWNWSGAASPSWDGIPFSSSPTASHSFDAAGSYRVWLQVRDSGGLTGTFSVDISVSQSWSYLGELCPGCGQSATILVSTLDNSSYSVYFGSGGGGLDGTQDGLASSGTFTYSTTPTVANYQCSVNDAGNIVTYDYSITSYWTNIISYSAGGPAATSQLTNYLSMNGSAPCAPPVENYILGTGTFTLVQ